MAFHNPDSTPSAASPEAASPEAASPEAAQRAAQAHLRHQLLTPLNQILGYAELLIEEADDEAGARIIPDLETIHGAGRGLLELINRHFDGATAVPALERAPLSAAPVGVAPAGVAPVGVAPAGVAPAGVAPAGVAPAAKPSRAGSHLLVVDDNALNRDVLRRRLEHEGHIVTLAPDGQSALQQMREELFDLVLLDILMPGVDGVQVLQQMRDDARLSRLPVIMLSALDELDYAVRCIELGADDYLPKPINPVLLRARIGACLEKKRLRDIETRLFEQVRESYEKLSALERWRDEWTQMLVHDLRTPLTSVLGGLQTLTFAGPMTPIQEEVASIATRSANSLLELVNDLLDIAKLESGTLTLELAPVAPQEVLHQAAEQVAALAQEKRIALHISPDNAPPVRADRDKLARVMVNLLGNALKFTPSDGEIRVAARPSPEADAAGVLFSVRDSGEGIPAHALPLIFQKFGQVASSSARQSGTGLGLTFCRAVVQEHGGTLEVESEEGRGSTFFFTLPVA